MDLIRLFIIDDNSIFLKHHIKAFDKIDNVVICGDAASREEAARNLLLLSAPPHVVLCDIALPTLDGIDAIKLIKAIYPDTEIVVYTVFEDENKVLRAIEAGASGYLLKSAELTKIREAIIDVYHGGMVIQPTLARKLLRNFALPSKKTPVEFVEHRDNNSKYSLNRASLTTRELECLQIISKGLSNQETASVLNVSTATVRTHLEHIYQKLDVSNRVEAITEGIRQGIIEL